MNPDRFTDTNVTPRYPYPENAEDMTQEEIGLWYQERLSQRENEKYAAFVVVLERLHGGERPESVIVPLMNAFHADPSEPVDIEELCTELGLDSSLVREVLKDIPDKL